MSYLVIHSKFDKENILCVTVSNISKLKLKDFKICFSLIYSIHSINNAKIINNIGRYYEVSQLRTKKIHDKWKFKIKLQKNKYNIYNISSDIQGVFCVDENEKFIELKHNFLGFYRPIKEKKYVKISRKNVKISIIPEPKNYKLGSKIVNFTRGFSIKNMIIKNNFKKIKKIIGNNKYFFEKFDGINVVLIKKNLKKEEYELEIKNDLVKIYSKSETGVFYALVSMLQISNSEKGQVKECFIHDYPKFLWRGMHLDCARQFYSVKQIIKLLNFMAIFKLNRFHWHFTDNEAWRLDLKSYPNLAKDLSFRGYGLKVPPTYGGGIGPTGGIYKKKDINKILKHAKSLCIEVMPEIDLPAHSWALVSNFKKLQEKNDLSWKNIKGGYLNNTINPALDYTWVFVKKVVSEVSRIFDFEYFHIGVDERPKNAWTRSPSINKLMKKNNLKNMDNIQDYFVNRMQNILKINKRKSAAWNEVVTKSNKSISNESININKNCLIFAWENRKKGIEAAKKGFDVIMCPAQKCYLDMAHNKSSYENGLVWAGVTDTKDIFLWNPLKKLENKVKNKIIGIQAQLWSETITNINFMDIMINPRLIAIAEVAWSKKTRNWSEFRCILNKIIKLTNLIGWKNHRY